MPFSRRQRNNGSDTTSDTQHGTTADSHDNSAANDAMSGSDERWYDRLADWLFGGDEREVDRSDDVERAADRIGESDRTGEGDMPGLLEEAVGEVGVPQETVERARERADDAADKVTLASGRTYAVTADDLAGSEPWKTIAQAHGMSPELLVPFNQHIVTVGQGDAAAQFTKTTELAPGVEIYIPSAEEILFGQCRQQAGSYDEAVTLYGQLAEGPNVALLTTARERASGRVGEAYGTKGVDGGYFMTANPTIAGASSRRTETHNDTTEYKVFWLADFWKCSLFMHDVVWSAGYEPHQSSNDHYLLAGRLHESPKFEEIGVEDARPGDCWQRFGGTRSNESHNAILSSFVQVSDLGGDYEEWTFSIIGAESERAAESERVHTIKKGTNENTQGKKIRFFRPLNTRGQA